MERERQQRWRREEAGSLGTKKGDSAGTGNNSDGTETTRPLWASPWDPASAQSHMPGWSPRCWHKMAPLAGEQAGEAEPVRAAGEMVLVSTLPLVTRGISASPLVSEEPFQASSTEILHLDSNPQPTEPCG